MFAAGQCYPRVTGRSRINSLLLLRLHEGAPRQHETTSIPQDTFKGLQFNMMAESAGCLLQTVALFASPRSYYQWSAFLLHDGICTLQEDSGVKLALQKQRDAKSN